jgi:hypothetical protein
MACLAVNSPASAHAVPYPTSRLSLAIGVVSSRSVPAARSRPGRGGEVQAVWYSPAASVAGKVLGLDGRAHGPSPKLNRR